jgi:hypothetical protein
MLRWRLKFLQHLQGAFNWYGEVGNFFLVDSGD